MAGNLWHPYDFLRETVQLLTHEYPYWNRSAGTDHYFFLTTDRGGCWKPWALKQSIVISYLGFRASEVMASRSPAASSPHPLLPHLFLPHLFLPRPLLSHPPLPQPPRPRSLPPRTLLPSPSPPSRSAPSPSVAPPSAASPSALSLSARPSSPTACPWQPLLTRCLSGLLRLRGASQVASTGAPNPQQRLLDQARRGVPRPRLLSPGFRCAALLMNELPATDAT